MNIAYFNALYRKEKLFIFILSVCTICIFCPFIIFFIANHSLRDDTFSPHNLLITAIFVCKS